MIPLKDENPKGLHLRYLIRKVISVRYSKDDPFELRPRFKTKAVDKGAEYFILRLDDGGKDPKHIDACRKAVLFYANEIKDHLPDLSKDLVKKYGKTNNQL